MCVFSHISYLQRLSEDRRDVFTHHQSHTPTSSHTHTHSISTELYSTYVIVYLYILIKVSKLYDNVAGNDWQGKVNLCVCVCERERERERERTRLTGGEFGDSSHLNLILTREECLAPCL